MFQVISGIFGDDIEEFDEAEDAFERAQQVANEWDEWVMVRYFNTIATIKPEPSPEV
jgi:hypothetical protein